MIRKTLVFAALLAPMVSCEPIPAMSQDSGEPRYEEPRYEEPRYEEPRYDDPMYVDPMHKEPTRAELLHENEENRQVDDIIELDFSQGVCTDNAPCEEAE